MSTSVRAFVTSSIDGEILAISRTRAESRRRAIARVRVNIEASDRDDAELLAEEYVAPTDAEIESEVGSTFPVTTDLATIRAVFSNGNIDADLADFDDDSGPAALAVSGDVVVAAAAA